MDERPHTFVIGTAGHVDHGKSTLVKALTGIDPDRLREGVAPEIGRSQKMRDQQAEREVEPGIDDECDENQHCVLR